MRVFFLVCLVSLCFRAWSDEIRLPLVRFDAAAAAKGAFLNPWGGAKKGSCRHDQEGGYLELRFDQTQATFSLPAMKRALSAVRGLGASAKVYVDYCVVSLDGRTNLEFVANGSHHQTMGLRRSGRWETVLVQQGGWNRNGKPYQGQALKNIYMGLNGSGVIRLKEIGFWYEGTTVGVLPQQSYRPLYTAGEASRPVALDGKVDRQEWSDAYHLERLPLGQDADNPTEVFVKGSDLGLMFGAICRKKDMGTLRARFQENTRDVWQDESIEFYAYDKWGSGNFRKLGVNANGAYGGIIRACDQEGLKIVTRRLGDRWEVEALLPWKYLTGGDRPVPFLHVNVTRNCYQGEALTRTGWSTLVWDAKHAFQPLGLKPKGTPASSVPRLVQLAPATYVLEMPPSATGAYTAYLVTPEGKRHAFSEVLVLGQRKFLPIQVPLNDSGLYEILVVGESKGRFVHCSLHGVTEALPASVRERTHDEFCIFPQPKKLVLGKERISLKDFHDYAVLGTGLDYAGAYFAREMREFYGLDLKPSSTSRILFGLSSAAGMQAALVRHGLTEEVARIRHDGFAISVRPEEILVVGKVPAGVLYGAHVLADMVKMSTGEVGEPVVRRVLLVDWPRVENRLFHQMQNAYYHSNKYEVGEFTRFLERFPVSARFNLFTFELSDFYQWQSVPLKVVGQAWTPAELNRVVDFVNDNGMTVIPCVQSHGHMEWWLFGRKGQLQELREDGCNDVICTRHPRTYPTLFSLYDEYNRAASRNPAYAPKFFYAGLDEVRWKTSVTPEDKRCKRCAGIPKNQIFVDNIKTINSYLNGKKQRMIMCTDMIVEGHNGLNEFKCAETADQIPKNVILAHWASLDFPTMKTFASKGYENWKLLTGYSESREGEEVVKGYGLAMYTYNWWLTKTRCRNSHGAYTLLPQRLVMDFAWNEIPQGAGIWKRRAHEYGKFLMHQWSRKPLRFAGKSMAAIPLDRIADVPVASEKGWLGSGKGLDLSGLDFSIKELAGIPVTFSRKSGVVQCVQASETVQVLPFNRRAASLLMVHGAHLAQKDADRFFSRSHYRDLTYGPVIAEYEVVYADGDKVTIPIRYGWNICDWRTGSARNQIFSRYVGDCRWLWTGRTPANVARKGPEDVVLYQYEWVNPRPQVAIKELRLRQRDKMVAYGMLALSMREVAEQR